MLGRFLSISALVGLTFATETANYLQACKAVGDAISSASGIYYPGDALYDKGVYHFAASSQQNSTCVVEPGTPEDISKILKVIDATRTPFAVMSGGHVMNPGFSSTPGIQIYTGRFSEISYDAASGTATIGTGLVWDTVYQRLLEEHGVTVIGGRETGIGVGGSLLGGGYSYKSNQYGLGVDNVVSFNLVLPNGTITCVSHSSHPDLFFGLKGGFNNFGIVTDFTVNAFQQPGVWGGTVQWAPANFGKVRSAIANFSAYSQDPKAVIIPSFITALGTQWIAQHTFYDGPTPPPGTFDNFTSIPAEQGELKNITYFDMFMSTGVNSTAGTRGSFHMIGVKRFSETILKTIEDEMTYWNATLAGKSAFSFGYLLEPFLQSYLSHATTPSAFPPAAARKPGHAPNPLIIYFTWLNPLFDNEFIAAMEESARRLARVAKAEGLLADHPVALYGNAADSNTPLVDIYGDNLPKLQALRKKIDPGNVMGLTGGFRF